MDRELNERATISRMVRNDYRTADVFRKYHINYCCGGNATLEEICLAQGLDPAPVREDLAKATTTVVLPSFLRFDEWDIDFLADYIVHVHHGYLKTALPALEANLQSFVSGHRAKLPFLDSLQDVFREMAAFILEHTEEEEQKIFPYIKQINHTYRKRETYGRLFVKNLGKPLALVLQSEHRHITALLGQIREITHNYAFEANACTTHQVVFHKLRELDADLVQHKHLENNILFPRAIALERELLHGLQTA